LNGNITNPSTYSDTLGSGSIRLLGNFSADVFGQYNTQLNRFVQTTVGGSWRPTPGRNLNFGYRNVWTPPVQASIQNNQAFTPGTTTTDQYNISGQWPLTREVSVLGRWGYDALTVKTLNTLVGFEWNRDCWTLRGAYSQMVNTSQITTTQVLFQIEFRGFASAGSNPIDIMRLNVLIRDHLLFQDPLDPNHQAFHLLLFNRSASGISPDISTSSCGSCCGSCCAK
jgi:LPS-assembly protein